MLVAQKEKLIEKLREKRLVLISQTVTKGLPPEAAKAAGLNPYPEMRDSGVSGLAQIPEHWNPRRIANAAVQITNGYVGPTRDIFVNSGVRYLQSLHIKNSHIYFDTPYYVEKNWSEEHRKSILNVGDVLIVQTGANTGETAVVTPEFAGCNCHALIIVKPRRTVLHGPFLSLFLNSIFGRHALKRIRTGALHPHLNCGLVRDVFFPAPPLSEQVLITEYLGAAIERLEGVIELVGSAIEKLKEYRSALITATVTGKIDVRNYPGD